MKLFPNVLIRVGGAPFDNIECLGNGNVSSALYASISEKEKQRDSERTAISDELYTLINSLSDPREQNILLNLRRDIFNGKKFSIEKARPVLPAQMLQKLEAHIGLNASIANLRTEQENAFNSELLEARKAVAKLASDEEFQKGLLLSSRTLLDRVRSYCTSDLASPKKKEQQTEQGLLKYITRMYCKTSPFSTFTNLVVAKVKPGREKFLTLPAGAHGTTSHIRLNNFLYNYLRTLLLKTKPAYRLLAVRPNPTVKLDGDHYLFLTNSQNIEAFQRTPADPLLELFLELTTGQGNGIRYCDLVQAIIEGEYIDATAEDIEGFIEQLLEFGFLEFNIGVSGIDPDWDIKFIEKLGPLAAENVQHISELMDVLRDMRGLANKYASAPLAERKKILDTVHTDFKAICMKLHEAAGLPADERKPKEELMAEYRAKQEEEKKKAAENKRSEGEKKTEEAKAEEPAAEANEKEKEEEAFRHISTTYFHFNPEQMFYEDTTRNVTPVLDEGMLAEFTQTVNDLMQRIAIYQGQLAEKDAMAHYFANKYGKDAEVSLLTYYEDFYREYKKPEKEKQDQLKKKIAERMKEAKEKAAKAKEDTSVPGPEAAEAATLKESDQPEGPQIHATKQRNELMQKWSVRLGEILREKNSATKDNTYHASLGDVIAANNDTGVPEQSEPPSSYGFFVQLFTEKDEAGKKTLKGVLNGTFPGFGKLMSRFLHIFDEEVTEDLRKWNLDMGGADDLLIEDCDASYFNANLHPPLLPYEIWMPGGHNSLPAEKQLPITDFTVKYNSATGHLDLVHAPTGKNAYVFDLGFQGHNGRSQLFQLLEKFTKTRYLFASPVASAVSNKANSKERLKDTAETLAVPRVVYENKIILQRRGWYIPRTELPLPALHETPCTYYNRINAWRRSLNIPDEVFVFINTDRFNASTQANDEGKRPGRDDYKPQYINFNSPLLVNLFEKITGKITHTLRIEEMMPASRDLFSFGTGRHVTEFMVQWYNFEGKELPEAVSEEMIQMNK